MDLHRLNRSIPVEFLFSEEIDRLGIFYLNSFEERLESGLHTIKLPLLQSFGRFEP